MNRVLLLLLVCGVVIMGIIACKGIVEPVKEDSPLFVLITDQELLVEGDYNYLALQGFQRAEDELDVRIETLQPISIEEYLPSIRVAIEKGAVLVVCNGASMAEAVQQAATEYPDQAFALIDGKVDAENVSSYTFAELDGAFLAGVAAATMSKTDIIGFVWDSENSDTEKYQYSFQAGVESVDNAAQVLINYTNYPGDKSLGKETALAQNKLGVDVIFHCSGGCGEGVIEASKEQGFWLIGMDNSQFVLNPENLLSVLYKGFDLATYMAIENYENGVKYGAQYIFSLDDGGVDLVDLVGNVDEETKTSIETWKKKIIDEKVIVPYDALTFSQFIPE